MKPPLVYLCKLVFPFVDIFIKRIEGKENIPQESSFVVASNHINGRDHFFIARFLKNRLEDLRFIGALDSLKILLASGLLYYLSNTLIVNRKRPDRKNLLKKAIKCLKEGKVIIIYPEGDTNSGPSLLKGKTGVAELAIRTEVPVVPVGMRVKNFFRREIRIGKPLYFLKESKLLGEIENNKKEYNLLLRKTTDRIMREISKLCNKPYPYEN